MGRAPCCDKTKVKRGPWSPEEDATLKTYLQNHGTGGNWIALPHKAGLNRCGKSCRLRWLNYLRPDIKHGGFTEEEDTVIWRLYNNIGSRWSVIASQLPGRTDNDVKNYWNTKLKKKLAMAGNTSFNHPTTTTSTTSNTTTSDDHHHPMSLARFSGLLPKTETAADHHHGESSACFDANSSSTLTYVDHQNFDLQEPKLDYHPSDQFCYNSNPMGFVSGFSTTNIHGKASSPSMSSTLSTSSPLGLDSNFGSWDGNGINNGGDNGNAILMDLGFDSYNDSLLSSFGF